MNKSKKIICIMVSVIFCLFCSACSGCNEKVDSADFYNFNTEIHVEVYNAKLSDEIKEQISTLLDDLEKEFSVNKSQSVISIFNAQQVGQNQTLTSRQLEVFNKALEYYDFSNQKFNPAVYSLSRLWKFSPNYPENNFTPPSQEQIDQILENGSVDLQNGLTLEGNVLTKQNADIKLDFGGIVKGYAVDKIAQILVNNDISEGYVNAGGSSMRILSSDTLGITHPRGQGQIINITEPLKNVSVSTSGDYQKYYEYDGHRYSHIIDATSGYPAQTGIVSATIICEDGTFADAMSTALCLCEYSNPNQLNDLIDKILIKYPSTLVFVVYQNKVLTNMTSGFTLLDSSYQIVKI